MMILITAAAALAICFAAATFSAEAEDLTYHENEKEAAAELRESMKQRRTQVMIGIKGSTDQEGLQKSIGRVIGMAADHTGKPDEGDYILFQYDHYEGMARTTRSEETDVVEIKYDLSYYDDADQEAEVDRKVAEIMEDLELDEKTDFGKIKAIHDYLCENIEYEAAEDGSDIRRTAYGALIEGKAVCQGYSVSLYRLLLEAGIDNRIIYGTCISPFGTNGMHTWNIVDLYGKYYYLDVTWDDCTESSDYFLVPAGAGFEEEHTADEMYEDESFTSRYPIADEAFKADTEGAVSIVEKTAKLIMKAMVAKN